jgi:hypothetical protein
MSDSATLEDEKRAVDPEPWTALIDEARAHAGDVRDAVKEIVTVKVERAQVAVIRAGLCAGTLILAATLGLAALVTAVVLVVQGTAGALAAALGGRAWAGNLAAGGGWIAVAAIGWLVARGVIVKRLDRAHALEHDAK